MLNALSVDLEDWYHPELIRRNINWQKINFIKDPAEVLLNLLDKYNTKATLFILGEVALQNPDLIKKIYGSGHEIACHGFSHRPLNDLGPGGLRKELSEFKKVITAILGDIQIKGFRAPTFSLSQNTSWAVDILKEFKYKYDSSIFPIKLCSYGVNRAPLTIYGLNSKNIINPDAKSGLKEFPITAFGIKGLRLPVSGGFYLRLIPFYFQEKFLKLINKRRPFIIYIHPWECDVNTPRIKTNILSQFISYYNIKSTLTKLEGLLNNFNFGRIDNILGV